MSTMSGALPSVAPLEPNGSAQSAGLQARLDGDLLGVLPAAVLPARHRHRRRLDGAGDRRRQLWRVRRARSSGVKLHERRDLSDGFFNIFFKLHFQKTYDGILATPMRVPDVAFGEMLWALTRGSLYAAAFLLVLLAVGEATGRPMLLSPWAMLAWPAAVLAAASFSAMALCLTSFARKIQDFDMVMGLLVMPMFLFSGIFVPITQFPEPVQWIMRLTPLYHAVSMLRQITTGTIETTIAGHVAYLVAGGATALAVAMHRLERALVK